MRFFKAAALLGLTATTYAIAVPEKTPEKSGPSDVLEVVGTADLDHVSIQFNTSCPGCFVGSSDEVELTLTIPKSHGECSGPNPVLNGVPLDQRWHGNEARGRGHFPVQADDEIKVSWRSVCVPGEGQVLSVRILQLVDGSWVRDASGFTASFKQDGLPTVLRLTNTPTRLGLQRHQIQSWLHPSEEQKLRIGSSVVVPPSALDVEFTKLADIKSNIAILHAVLRKQEHTIIHMLRKDFKQCEGIQCMLQTAMQKAPDFAHLIAEHFSHEKVKLRKTDQFGEIAFVGTLELPEPSLPLAEEAGPMKENPAQPAPPPFDGDHRPDPPFEGEHPHPPFKGELPHPPPWADEHPHPPFEGGHPPLFHGEHPPPPPPPPHHEGPPPPHNGDHHHPPPPPDHGHGLPPPPPPQDGEHPPPPPHHGDGAHGPPGRHHHGRPSFFHHIRHGRSRILKAALALLAGSFLMSLLFGALRKHLLCCRDPRRRAERASRREERRARCEYRRAAHRHRILSWWATHKPRRGSAARTTDYDEKRTLILQQEGILEAVMQNEIRNLETAAELEEGRGRSHIARVEPHELDSQPSNSRLNQQQNYAASDYSAPPPQYEAELDDDMMVVNGFGYTPSNTDDTPESSIVDFSPRMSTETLFTDTAKSDRMD